MTDTASDPNQMLSTQEAARLLGLQPSTLSAWREDGSQPGFDLPPMEGAENAPSAMGAILASVASDELTPSSEATGIAGLVEAYRKAPETTDLKVARL